MYVCLQSSLKCNKALSCFVVGFQTVVLEVLSNLMNSEKYHYENNVKHTISAVKAELEREHSGAPSFMDRPPQSSTLYYY